MGFFLGSFTNGLFGGAQAVASTYGAIQGIQARQAQMDAAGKVAAAMGAQGDPNAPVPYQPVDTTTPTTDQSSQPDTSTSSGPIDYTKLPAPKSQTKSLGGGRRDRDSYATPSTPNPAASATPPDRDDGSEGALENAMRVGDQMRAREALDRQNEPPSTGPVSSAFPTPPGGYEAPAAPANQVPTTVASAVPPGSSNFPGAISQPQGGAPAAPNNYPGALSQGQPQMAQRAAPGTPIGSRALPPMMGGQAPTLANSSTQAAPQATPAPAAPNNFPGAISQPQGGPPAAPNNFPGQQPQTALPPPATPQQAAQQAAQPAPTTPSSALGNKLLGALHALNPISTAQAAQTAPAPAAPTTGVTPAAAPAALPTTTPAKVAPGQQGPTSQSEPAPKPGQDVPAIDPRPMAALIQERPKAAEMVEQVADQAKISPMRLALHWGLESNLATTAPTSKTGAIGPLQIEPATWTQFDPHHQYDISKLPGALHVAAMKIAYDDATFGRDTPSSVGAYQGGAGSIHDILSGGAAAHPNTIAYIDKAFPGQDAIKNLHPALSINVPQAVQAGLQGGPIAFLHTIAQTVPRGTPSSDLWNAAETSMVKAALMRGDVQGALHARDFVFQMSHSGMVASTMHAYQALQAGNGAGAAQYLAQAHAFVPDGQAGQFGVDKNGNVFGQMVDEHTGKKIGAPFQVTPDKLMGLLNTAQNPQEYLAGVMAQQKQAAELRLMDQHGAYYSDMIQGRRDVAAIQAQERADASRNAVAASYLRGAQAAQTRVDAQHAAVDKQGQALDKEVINPNAAPLVNTIGDPAQKALAARVYTDLRANSPSGHMPPQAADDLAAGVIGKRYSMQIGQDGRAAIVDKQGRSLAYLSPHVAQSLMSYLQPNAQGALPAGRGAPPQSKMGEYASSAIPMPSTALH